MNSSFEDRVRYWLGQVLKAWSVFGALATLLVIIALPIYSRRVGVVGEEFLLQVSAYSSEIAQVLLDGEDALLKTAVTLDASAAALQEAQVNINELDPLLESVQVLLGEEAPDTIIAAQSALESTQSGARAMDRALRVLSSIRILTGVSYNSEKPLDEAMLDVAESLEPLPAQLLIVSKEIGTYRSTLDGLEPKLSKSLDSIVDMAESLRSLSSSLSNTANGMETFSQTIKTADKKLEQIICIGVFIFELVAFQSMLIQLTTWYVGSQLVSKNRSTGADVGPIG
jgi:methyl-accepting chemotaxis protein